VWSRGVVRRLQLKISTWSAENGERERMMNADARKCTYEEKRNKFKRLQPHMEVWPTENCNCPSIDSACRLEFAVQVQKN